MSVEANKALIRRYFESWNTNDVAVLDEIVAHDVVDHTANPEQLPGREGFREFYRAWHHAFPGFRAEIEEMIAEGNSVATRWTFSGRHLGTYHGIEATGRDVSFSAVSIEHIENGLITDEWFIADTAEFIQQLIAP